MQHRQEISSELRGLIAAQRGIVRSDQAALHGVGRRASTRLVSQGHWQRVAPGLFDTAPLNDDFEKRAWAALLAGGDRAAIGGSAALTLHGLSRDVDEIEVWVPPGSQPDPIPGVRMRRDRLRRTDRARGLLTRISMEDALIDVGQYLPTERLVALLSDAARLRATTLHRVAEAVQARGRVRGRKRFEELLGDLSGVESTLEYAYQRDVERAHGLPVGRRNISVSRGTRTDVVYEEYGVLVELDGRFGHDDASSAFRDMNRDNIHMLSGRPTLRYGSADVRGRFCEVAVQVGGFLLSKGWPGPLLTCRHCRFVTA